VTLEHSSDGALKFETQAEPADLLTSIKPVLASGAAASWSSLQIPEVLVEAMEDPEGLNWQRPSEVQLMMLP